MVLLILMACDFFGLRFRLFCRRHNDRIQIITYTNILLSQQCHICIATFDRRDRNAEVTGNCPGVTGILDQFKSKKNTRNSFFCVINYYVFITVILLSCLLLFAYILPADRGKSGIKSFDISFSLEEILF